MKMKLMLIAALTLVLGARVMAHEGGHHDEPTTNNQDKGAENKPKEQEQKGVPEQKGEDRKQDTKGAKAKKSTKKKAKKVKADESKSAMPAGMPMK